MILFRRASNTARASAALLQFTLRQLGDAREAGSIVVIDAPASGRGG